MISFYNDYNELAHPKIMEDLMKFQGEKNVGYSEDYHVATAVKYIKNHLKRDDVDIHFIHGGTLTNIMGLMTMLKRHEGVIAADTGHIVGHENGSIEAIGTQIVQVPNQDGKVTVEEIEKALYNNRHEWSVDLKVVYISNATELGTIYTKKELKALHESCQENDLYLFIDGARMGTAITSYRSDLDLSDICEYSDVFSIGGTKNGMLMGEALVIVNDQFKPSFRRILKQRGGLLAKGYLMGIQFETMFKTSLYFELAQHANLMAEYMAYKLEEKGVDLYKRQESNLVFAILSKEQIARTSEEFKIEVNEDFDKDHKIVRLAMTWATKREEVEAFIEAL